MNSETPSLVLPKKKTAQCLRLTWDNSQIIGIQQDGWRGVAFSNKDDSSPTIPGVVMIDPKCARELSEVFARIAKQLEDKKKAVPK